MECSHVAEPFQVSHRMTTDDRVVVLRALWLAVRHTDALSAGRARRAIRNLQGAIEAVYNRHGDVRMAEAYEQGRRDAETSIATAREEAFRAGMIAVQKRADFREAGFPDDPEELRSIH